MLKWWNWVLAFSLCCLLFVVLPLLLSSEPSEETLKPIFDDYIQKYNKSYANLQEYSTRFQHFVIYFTFGNKDELTNKYGCAGHKIPMLFNQLPRDSRVVDTISQSLDCLQFREIDYNLNGFDNLTSSYRQIQKLNAASRDSGSSGAKYGLTKLSDMSQAEFKEIHLSDEKVPKAPQSYNKNWKYGKEMSDTLRYDIDPENRTHHHWYRSGGNKVNVNLFINIRTKRVALPMTVDWRTKGIIGPVRNQGLCGACWAFSTIGVIEAMSAIETGKLETLSVQEVIDCAKLGNKGCAGGDICLLLDWLLTSNTGIEVDKLYPLSLTNGVCKVNKTTTGVKVASFTCDDFVGSENKILEALALHGPVAVAVNALTWQHYLGGVIQFHCSGLPEDLNHAVELVGYDLTAEVPYYIAKNSWGEDYGNSGYVYLAIGSNMCGLANEVATVTVK